MVTRVQRRAARATYEARGKLRPGNAKKLKRQLRAAGLSPRKRRKK